VNSLVASKSVALFEKLLKRHSEAKNRAISIKAQELKSQVRDKKIKPDEAEGKSKEIFNHELVMTLLPLLTQQMQTLNRAYQSEGGFNYANVISAAGSTLHSAVPKRTSDPVEIGKEKKFFRDQVDILFDVLLPKTLDEWKELLSRLDPALNPILNMVGYDLNSENYDAFIEKCKTFLVSQIPTILDYNLNKEVLLPLILEMYKSMTTTMNDPNIAITPLVHDTSPEQRELDEEVGKLFLEAVRFFDLPFQYPLNLPFLVKKVTGVAAIERSIPEYIGASLRPFIKGDMLPNMLEKSLKFLVEQKYARLTDNDIREEYRKQKIELPKIEKALLQSTFTYGKNYASAYIHHKTNFSNRFLKFVRNVVFAVASFMFIRVLGKILNYFKVEERIIDYLLPYLNRSDEKALKGIGDVHLNKDFLYKSIEGIEKALA